MDEQLEKRVCFLRAAHTEGMPHTERGLLDHLLGTRQSLIDWEARPAVRHGHCIASAVMSETFYSG